MSSDFVAVPENASVAETVELIRRKKSELKEKFIYVYAVDGMGRLVGVLQLRDLLLSDSEAPVRDIASVKPVCLRASDSEEKAALFFRKHRLLALPVVDDRNVLVGIVTAADVADIVQLDSDRKIRHFAGMSGPIAAGEEIEGKSVLKIVSRRLPWLLLSMTSGLMCAYIVGIFIEEIESMIALVLFIPIVLGVAGGVGVQSSVIVLRGLEEGKLRLSEVGKVLLKETAIGLLIGLVSCLAVAFTSLFWQKDPMLGVALGSSIVACVVASGFLGALLPVILRTFRIDPAFASGLFVLVICDIAVMIIYFSLSFAIIGS